MTRLKQSVKAASVQRKTTDLRKAGELLLEAKKPQNKTTYKKVFFEANYKEIKGRHETSAV